MGKIPILTNIFQRGWNHQLVIIFWHLWNPTQDAIVTTQMIIFSCLKKSSELRIFFPRMRIGIREGNWDEDPMKIWDHTVDGWNPAPPGMYETL